MLSDVLIAHDVAYTACFRFKRFALQDEKQFDKALCDIGCSGALVVRIDEPSAMAIMNVETLQATNQIFLLKLSLKC